MGHMCDMARDDHQMRIRLPESLLTSLREHAEARNRSLNAEIVARLGASFEKVDVLVSQFHAQQATVYAMVAHIMGREILSHPENFDQDFLNWIEVAKGIVSDKLLTSKADISSAATALLYDLPQSPLEGAPIRPSARAKKADDP